jgi:hypothetical protein
VGTRLGATGREVPGRGEDIMSEQNWPEPTDSRPDREDLQDMLSGEGDTDATDGCYVEPDGVCEHGHPSWPLYLGLI